MRLNRYEVGIGGVAGDQVVVYVRNARGSTWTKAFTNGPKVKDQARADWLRDITNWHYAPGDIEVKEMSLVYEHADGALYVTSMGAITARHIAEQRIDVVVSLEPLREDAAREVIEAQRVRAEIRHLDCVVRDLTPQYWGDMDLANAKRAVEGTLDALNDGKRVAVHCLMGVHRSPALATAVVSASAGVSLDEASLMIRSRRALAMNVPETTAGFAQFARPAATGK